MSQIPSPFQNREVSVGNWMWTMVVMCIPVVSLVMCFVWAFSGSVVPSKRNYFKAVLVWKLVAIIALVILYFILLGMGISIAQFFQQIGRY